MANDSRDERDAKSYAERADPGGQARQQADLYRQAAGSPLARALLKMLGVPAETLAQLRTSSEQMIRLLQQPERIATALAPLGWVYHGLAHVDRYAEAAKLVEQGKAEEAEELLVTTYNEHDHAFIRFYNRVFSLYAGSEERRQIGIERRRLLDEAYELHKEGRYAGCIPIVLAQIDGIFIDMTSKPARYFYDERNPNLVDDTTLAGHPLGLKQLAKLMGEPVTSTDVTDKLTRQGILHGRVLGYDTLRNSTKTWAALLAVIEAMQPRAQQIIARDAEAYERRWAGSKEVDEWGARRDRRGFDDAKQLLQHVRQYQYGYRTRHGRFARSRQELDPDGQLLRRYLGQLQMRVSDDASEFWAWVRTPTEMVFGIAARDGEFNNWWVFVADGEQPEAGVGSPGWKHILEADFPDW